MMFADPADFALRAARWAVQTIGAHVAGLLGQHDLKKDMAAIDGETEADDLVFWSSKLEQLASADIVHSACLAGEGDVSEIGDGDSVGVPNMLLAAARFLELVATAAVDAANAYPGSIEARAEAGYAASHAYDAAFSLALAGNDTPAKEIGSELVRAWRESGGSVEPLRRPGINQLLVHKARECGLDMSDWHCGSAHCIAGWYVVLAEQFELEHAFSCWFAAALVFAVNNPGAVLPYTGSSKVKGLAELDRLEKLNPSGASAATGPQDMP